MKVLVIGATGYLGSVVAEVLVARGHQVTAMVRGARDLPPRIAQRVADLGDVDAVRTAVGTDIDAVVHAATPLGDWDRERRSVQAATEALGSPGKRFVYVSGVWVLGGSTRPDGSTEAHDEWTPPNPVALMAGREAMEADVLRSPVTGVVVRPGVLHGRGAGIPGLMTSWAAAAGRGVYVGDDDDLTWATVHVEDAARLVALAVEEGTPGQVLHAVSEPAVRVSAIAAAAGAAVGRRGSVHRRTTPEAADDLGADFAEALGLSQRVHARIAPRLGWRPTGPGIVDDLRSGSYATSRTPAGAESGAVRVEAWCTL